MLGGTEAPTSAPYPTVTVDGQIVWRVNNDYLILGEFP